MIKQMICFTTVMSVLVSMPIWAPTLVLWGIVSR